jgi:DNA-binding HxlR family transcriptional regulator
MTLSPPEGVPSAGNRRRRGAILVADCPSRIVLQHVTSRWAVLAFFVLLRGTHRFGDLRRAIDGVSEKMLAQTLQVLEGDGFVVRKAYDEVPPRVEYRLSPLGIEIAKHVESLAHWIEGNLPRIAKQRLRLARGSAACDDGVNSSVDV